MKANAPEKLYISKNIYSTYLYQVPDPDDDTTVEYTRTDAFINHLEVKEVDLEKEIENYLSTYWPEKKELHPFLGHMAKHFFELGIKVAQKGELYMTWFTLLNIVMAITIGGWLWVIEKSNKPLKGE